MVTACGGEDPEERERDEASAAGASPSTSSSRAPSPTRFDPPREFAPEGELVAEGEGYAVAGDAVVSVVDPSLDGGDAEESDSVVSVRVRGMDGRVRTEFRTPFGTAHEWNGPFAEYTLGGPATATLGDRHVVLLAGTRVIEGSGTYRDQYDYVFRAHDAGTGDKVWQRVVEVDSGAGVSHQVIGANSEYTVIETASKTYVLRTSDGETVWSSADIDPVVLAGDTLVVHEETGFTSARPVGLDAADGDRLWEGPGVDYVSGTLADQISVVTPTTVVLRAKQADGAGSVHETYLVSVDDGSVRETLEGEWSCRHGTDTIVCGTGGGMVAFDAESVETLWELPDDRREAPTLHAVHNGVVYVSSSDGLMTLDARSGSDLDHGLGLSGGRIVDVRPGYALVEWDGDGSPPRLRAHRAVG
ncbi:outer membrane protein assembly factor BamB family protein [Saccharomonospora saliphila]|uniref:outer membrane protein assembly factor BamB family protein n=1 Tax=Saccharomonospora saliphila TaxID=369829 RepID=UPI0012F9D5AE|nr:PQQ-binding-like beta-propeller repeat protein [Saccharomonospora saliphila]